MLRITFIAGTYQPERCGVAHYTARLTDSLSEEVLTTVLTTYAAAEALNSPHVKGVVHDWKLAHLIPLVRAVQSTAADILHIQHAAGTYGFQRPIFLLPLLLRSLGYSQPIVTTIHEYGWWEWEPPGIPPQLLEWLKQWGQQRGWWDREDGFLLTGSETLITTNAEAQRVIEKRLPHLANRLHRIPIGANVEVAAVERVEARQRLRQQYCWSPDTLILAFFGFLHPVKGIENLLTAFKQTVAQAPQLRLLLLGGVESLALPAQEADRYWHQLRALIAELQLEDLVVMTGYLAADTASHYLSGADIGVLPFNHGTTLKSGSLLTLMAHGLPVVATRHEPPDPDLENEDQLYLVPARSPEALREALLRLIEDREKRHRLGATGRAFVRRFAWSDIAQKHLHIYDRLLP